MYKRQTSHAEATDPIQGVATAATGGPEDLLSGTALLREARAQREESHRQALESVVAQCTASLAELSDDDRSEASFGTAVEANLSNTGEDGV